MKKLFKKNKRVKIIIIVIVIFVGYKIIGTANKTAPAAQVAEKIAIETFSIGEYKTAMLEAFCSVEASADAGVTPEAGGKVNSVLVSDGDVVKKGQTLFTLANIQQRVSVENAKVSLKSAELALADLLNNNDSKDSASLLNQTTTQQEAFVSNAKNTYLNADLLVYPEDYDESSEAPVISGNYSCEAEGEYTLDLYASGGDTGATIRLSGLESGRASVSVDFPVPIGNCGLEIVFPETFKKTSTWTIPVPNTRSSVYVTAQKAYESKVSGKDIAINNTQTSPEQIARERARVSQARLQLQSARDTLAKTIVQAPVAGTLSGFDVDAGDFITSFVEIARVKSIGDLELVSYINADEKKYITIDAEAQVGGMHTVVSSVAATVDTQTRKIKIILDVPEKADFTEGTQMSCQINRFFNKETKNPEDGVIIPLSALSIIGQDAYIFEIKDQKATKKKVDVGALLGKDIVIYGINTGDIIRDARGIREGQDLSL